tara:strand:+ start:945 stop:1307 length:363 start_codon:yes stop_codon:yes gene_type:complete
MKQNISKAAKAYGVSASLAHNRIKMGWDFADAISRPPRKYVKEANRPTKPERTKKIKLETSELFSREAQLKLFADGQAKRQAQIDLFHANTSKRRNYASFALVAAVTGLVSIVIYASVAG